VIVKLLKTEYFTSVCFLSGNLRSWFSCYIAAAAKAKTTAHCRHLWNNKNNEITTLTKSSAVAVIADCTAYDVQIEYLLI